ncbi:MAG: hypothetical protein RBS34_14965 [Desulfofustis sp.]|jgi:hypothetical protein|nr:hypothetical protein [Desulfofustis sp.]
MKSMATKGLHPLLVAVLLLSAGCQQMGNGGLLADLGLTRDPASPIANVERALHCLAESGGQTNHSFATVRRSVEADLARESVTLFDWSELVCIALGDTATPRQIGQTIDVLSVIAARQQPAYLPLQGLVWILAQRKAMLEDSAAALQDVTNQLGAERRRRLQEKDEADKLLEAERRRARDQREQVKRLENQVRELKEVELKLQPQTPDLR